MITPAAPISSGGISAAAFGSKSAFQLTAEESARFLRIISEGTLVKRHYEIYRWLSGEMQQFLPHDIFISAWGDFSRWSLNVDITSGLPGVRTAQLAHCSVDDLVNRAHVLWLEGGRRPVLLNAVDTLKASACACPLHAALRSMRSLVVHGMRDQRFEQDSLYIALSRGSLTNGRCRLRFASVMDALIPQIDSAFRKVAVLPLGAVSRNAQWNVLDLSSRERQILESVCVGRTNSDIALALDISPFTVKNHVQRIFRKIGVTNRTQAAARYTAAIRHRASQLTVQGNVQHGEEAPEVKVGRDDSRRPSTSARTYPEVALLSAKQGL